MRRLHHLSSTNDLLIAEAHGCTFHSLGEQRYWSGNAYYELNDAEVAEVLEATKILHDLCLEGVHFAIQNQLYEMFKIPRVYQQLIEMSWKAKEPSIYGRFDICYDGATPPKLYEYNADTPTSLVEGGRVQRAWLRDHFPGFSQCNSISESLSRAWARTDLVGQEVYFASVRDSLEDYENVRFMMDCAQAAGLHARFICVEDIAWDYERQVFVDTVHRPIRTLFKLYPWEWLCAEEFGRYVLFGSTRFIEPAWKMFLSNKALLVLLWKLFPGHPNLLPASFSRDDIPGGFVRKPLLSREGANVCIEDGALNLQTQGSYGAEGFVYQQFKPLPSFEGKHPVLGSWVIGDVPAGIGIREDSSLVTGNLSEFVPHVVVGTKQTAEAR